ncbi:hypothetical protein NPIL_100941 [Nephila pilipes]|uniref:Uncharacterized protein n=1 Tax=Nephila pilipes TaxID=299642 RepID=A0A8X6NDI3_NEPPI|nr:hypothetical protein NPIL_100941 [Nephila pilipes]
MWRWMDAGHFGQSTGLMTLIDPRFTLRSTGAKSSSIIRPSCDCEATMGSLQNLQAAILLMKFLLYGIAVNNFYKSECMCFESLCISVFKIDTTITNKFEL